MFEFYFLIILLLSIIFFFSNPIATIIHELGHLFFLLFSNGEAKYFVISNRRTNKFKYSFNYKKIKFVFSPIVIGGFVQGTMRKCTLTQLKLIGLGALIFETIFFILINYLVNELNYNYIIRDLNFIINFMASFEYIKITIEKCFKFFCLSFLYGILLLNIVNIALNFLIPFLLQLFGINLMLDGAQFYKLFFINNCKEYLNTEKEKAELERLNLFLPLEDQKDFLDFVNKEYEIKKK